MFWRKPNSKVRPEVRRRLNELGIDAVRQRLADHSDKGLNEQIHIAPSVSPKPTRQEVIDWMAEQHRAKRFHDGIKYGLTFIAAVAAVVGALAGLGVI